MSVVGMPESISSSGVFRILTHNGHRPASHLVLLAKTRRAGER
jgi:hypothetical protein